MLHVVENHVNAPFELVALLDWGAQAEAWVECEPPRFQSYRNEGEGGKEKEEKVVK